MICVYISELIFIVIRLVKINYGKCLKLGYMLECGFDA